MMQHEGHGRKRARALLSRAGYRAGGHVKAEVVKGVHAHESALHPGEKKTPAKKLKDGGCADGGMAKPRADRLKRGGKAHGHKGHKSHTTVNVLVGRSHPQPVPVPKPVPVPVPAGGPPGGPIAGPPPGAGPMPSPDGGGAPPPMGLKKGGRVASDSGRDKKGGMPEGHFKKGGRTKGYPIDDGSGGGLGRLEKAKAYGA